MGDVNLGICVRNSGVGCRHGVCRCRQALWSHAVKRSQSGFVGFHADYRSGIFQLLLDL